MMQRRSFTIFEMILAIALLTALVFTLLPSASRVMSSTARSAERSDRLAQLAVLSDLIDRSLFTALATDAAGAPGISGSSSSLTLTFCGVDLDPGSAGRIDDIGAVVISHQRSAREITASTSGNPGRVILRGVEKIELKYHNGTRWNRRHAGTAGLPKAVSLAIWFGDAVVEDEEETQQELFDDLDDDEADPDWLQVFAVFEPDVEGEI